MRPKVCLAVGTMYYPEGGGWQWVPLNWTLGLRAAGCEVVWLEGVTTSAPVEQSLANLELLRRRLEPFGLGDRLGVFPWDDPIPAALQAHALAVDNVADADLLLDLSYGTPQSIIDRFRRSALVDIDPGLLQVWVAAGQMAIQRHDVYFTIGETVGTREALFSDCGVQWHYTPPPVALDEWTPHPVNADAPYTTVSDWWGEWISYDGELYANGKRDGFLPYVDLPSRTSARLELALALTRGDHERDGERAELLARGWSVAKSWAVAGSLRDFRAYVRGSRGEFSCAKPSCARLQNAWISDRTLCYLASGKPAVVEHTGPSRILPDGEGMFRFRTPDEAVAALERTESDYERHSRAARALAEEHFDARRVAESVLERAL